MVKKKKLVAVPVPEEGPARPPEAAEEGVEERSARHDTSARVAWADDGTDAGDVPKLSEVLYFDEGRQVRTPPATPGLTSAVSPVEASGAGTGGQAHTPGNLDSDASEPAEGERAPPHQILFVDNNVIRNGATPGIAGEEGRDATHAGLDGTQDSFSPADDKEALLTVQTRSDVGVERVQPLAAGLPEPISPVSEPSMGAIPVICSTNSLGSPAASPKSLGSTLRTEYRANSTGQMVSLVVPKQLEDAQRHLQRLSSLMSVTSDGGEYADDGLLFTMGMYGGTMRGTFGTGSFEKGPLLPGSRSPMSDGAESPMSGAGQAGGKAAVEDASEEGLFQEAFEEAAQRGADGDGLDDVDDDEMDDVGKFETRKRANDQLLYGLERCMWYFQAMAIILSVKVHWGPQTLEYAGYLWHTLDYPVYWLYVMAEWLQLREVLFMWDLISYGVLVCVPPFLLYLLFNVWTVPDYTDADFSRKWMDTYVSNWWSWRCGTFMRSFILFLSGGAVTYTGKYFLKVYVGQKMDIIFAAGAGGIILAMWLIYLICVLLIRRDVLNATKGVPMVAADHIIKGIVTTKIRIMLFLVMITYVPTVFYLIRGITMLLDWNDSFTTAARRTWNYHIPCYFMAFPPKFDPDTYTTVAVVLFWYLGDTVFESFRETDWYDNFEFFNNIYTAYRDRLKQYPKYRVRIEETRQYLEEVYQTWREGYNTFVPSKAIAAVLKKITPRWLKKLLKARRRRLRQQRLQGQGGVPERRWRRQWKRLKVCRPKVDVSMKSIMLKMGSGKHRFRRKAMESKASTKSFKTRRLDKKQQTQTKRNMMHKAHARTGVTYQYKDLQSRWRQMRTIRHHVKEYVKARDRRNEEYVEALNYFEDDHELLISGWETVLDCSGYLGLIELFDMGCRYWRLVQMAECFLFCLLVVPMQRRQSPAETLGSAIMVELLFTFLIWWYAPFLHWRQRFLEYLIKAQMFFNLFVGVLLEFGWSSGQAADALLLISNISTVFLMLVLLNVMSKLYESIVWAAGRSLDAYIVTFIYNLLDQRWSALEQSNKGLVLIQQWDDLIREQQWHLLMSRCSVRPPTLLSTFERLVYLKWAAMRNLTLTRLRSWKGLNVLHAAMVKGDPLAVRWLIASYRELLEEKDDSFDTPYVKCLRECADRLLKFEQQQTQKLFYEVAKYFEILLSPEFRDHHLQWDKRRYKFLRDRANPLLGTLTQLLAHSCNLDPPKGFSRMDEWVLYADSTVKFLAETLVASRAHMDLSDSGLGNVAFRALLAVLDSLAQPRASIPLNSLFFVPPPNQVQVLNLSGNRLDDSVGTPIATVLTVNKTLTHLDLSDNMLGDKAGVMIARALGYNKKIRTLDVHTNILGAEGGTEIAKMLRRNRSITYLDLSNNLMGPKTYWTDAAKKVVQGAGEALASSLASNKTILTLNLANNSLGIEFGVTLATALTQNESLTNLDIEQNDLRAESGAAIGRSLEYRNSLARLNIRKNSMGPEAGIMFASALRKNMTLTSLDISGNNIGTDSGGIIALALKDNSTLTHLDLSGNGCGPDVFKYIGYMLKENCTLTALNLNRSHFGTASYEARSAKDMGYVFDSCLGENKTLIRLDLAHCKIPPLDLVSVTAGIKKNTALLHLDLTGHNLQEVSVVQLGTRMRYFEMQSLNLHDCDIELKPGEVLTRALTASEHLHVLDLGGSRLGPDAALRLAKFLSRKTAVIKLLNLDGNNIGNPGGIALAQMMVFNRSLEELYVSRNSMGHDFAREFSKSIRTVYENGLVTRFCMLKVLDLSYNPLGDRGVRRIVHSLRSNDVTERVNLAGTQMGVSACKEVAELIRRAVVKWRYLNIADNDLGKENVNEVLWALRLNFSLRHLVLASNKLGPSFGTEKDEVEDNGIAMVEAISSNYTLKVLDLADNGLSPECGLQFVGAIHDNPSLISIALERNQLDDQAMSAIAQFLQHDTRFTDVRLRGNHAGWKGCLEFADMIRVNTFVNYLDLADNLLGESATDVSKKLAKALVYNVSIKHLDLAKNRMGPEFGRALAKSLLDNRTLTYVNAENNRFDSTVGAAMSEMLKVNKSLLTLSITDVEIGIDAFRAIMAEVNQRC